MNYSRQARNGTGQKSVQKLLNLPRSRSSWHLVNFSRITTQVCQSAYGVGAVISHALSNGSERPIAFASHALTGSERNHAQNALSFQCEEVLPKGREISLITEHMQTPYNHTGVQDGQTISGSRSISAIDYSFVSNMTMISKTCKITHTNNTICQWLRRKLTTSVVQANCQWKDMLQKCLHRNNRSGWHQQALGLIANLEAYSLDMSDMADFNAYLESIKVFWKLVRASTSPRWFEY